MTPSLAGLLRLLTGWKRCSARACATASWWRRRMSPAATPILWSTWCPSCSGVGCTTPTIRERRCGRTSGCRGPKSAPGGEPLSGRSEEGGGQAELLGQGLEFVPGAVLDVDAIGAAL